MLQRRSDPAIVIRGARQNNLKNLSLEIPTGELVVVTGVSGSGKSSLVFDTLYAEGQRRYVETFSPYARQFLDRMDKPQVDAVDGIPPAIAIDQTNPVRTSRSTVGTMTELNDHLKLLFARAAMLYCRGCGKPVTSDSASSIFENLVARAKDKDPRLVITFPIPIPKNFTEKEIEELLQRQGYTRIHARSKGLLEVVQDRVRISSVERERVIEALESALRVGQGRVNIYEENGAAHRFSSDLHCPDCDIHYSEPTPAAFSFNSPLGACEACRGFGRTIGVDFGLVVPNENLTLRDGCIRPWQSPSFKECQDDLVKYEKKRGIPLEVPFNKLNSSQKTWVLEGEPEWQSWRKSWPGTWYGVRRFFKWLETKAYKMHIRVLLSKYRAYTECQTCHGTRLKPDSLLWKLDGKSIHELMLLSVSGVKEFFENLALPAPMDAAARIPAWGAARGGRGGECVLSGRGERLAPESTPTAEYLPGRRRAVDSHDPPPPRIFLTLEGAAAHNLKNLDVRLPLERLVCVTGVSGSGKSTLIQDVLYPALRKSKGKPTEAPGSHRALKGAHQVSDVVLG